MSEQEIIYISVIMQLVVDGKANLNNLSPGVRSFLEGAVSEYINNPEDEQSFMLYHYATTVFNANKEEMN